MSLEEIKQPKRPQGLIRRRKANNNAKKNSSVKKVTFSDKKKKMTKNELFRRVPIDELDMEEIAPEISEDDAPRYTALSQNKDPDCYKKILSPEFFSEEMINSQDQAEPEESNIPSLEDCLSMML
eukprot:CAMPEP_0205819498 /NCGR_PEP_ID=MMETSP0206-20130828/1901_1 /ASSEMBLY_ACC=CAM_ASM_000279 /TAXON_ID=36767 /ORGANISM="Euplotes focardii, Strain TN1" /LENGTH=124 /DNA_ID=CAMNT_0053113167 /DNA_START=13 /DNA_END=387 /DNA_ORIENTATION=-